MRISKSLGVPNKTVISNINPIEDRNTLSDNTRSISKIFKESFLINPLVPGVH